MLMLRKRTERNGGVGRSGGKISSTGLSGEDDNYFQRADDFPAVLETARLSRDSRKKPSAEIVLGHEEVGNALRLRSCRFASTSSSGEVAQRRRNPHDEAGADRPRHRCPSSPHVRKRNCRKPRFFRAVLSFPASQRGEDRGKMVRNFGGCDHFLDHQSLRFIAHARTS